MTHGVKQAHLDSGPNMTPLVDVVMVILIFLMLAGGFGGVEHYLASTLPGQTGGSDPGKPRGPFDETRIDLCVDGGLRTTVPNQWTARLGNLNTSNAADLRKSLIQHRLEYASNRTLVDQIEVVINPNQHVKWESLVSIYQVVLEAGYTRVAFSQAH